MRNKGWLRYSLASLTLVGAGLGMFLVACGDDDDNVTARDGGNNDTGPGTDGSTDASTDQTNPKPDAGTPARLQLINAATDLGPNLASGALRVCFAAGGSAAGVTVTPIPALPEQGAGGRPPGVPIGLGGTVQGTGLDLTPLFIQPYLMNAESLALAGAVRTDAGASTGCSNLLAATFDAGAGPLVENKDYWKLPVIEANTLKADKSYLLVLTGCTNDTEIANKEKCGPGFTADGSPGVGNLQVRIIELDRATQIPADKIGAGFIHASAPGNVAFTAGGVPIIPGFQSTPGDVATFKPLAAADAGVALNGKTDLAQVSGVTVATDSFSLNPAVADMAIPLATIQAISYPTGVPTGGAYANGAAFTFVAVGDPAEPKTVGGQPNPKTFHVLGFPNNPEPSYYKP